MLTPQRTGDPPVFQVEGSASRALSCLQRLAASSQEDLIQSFLSIGCEALGADFAAYTERHDNSLATSLFDRAGGVVRSQQDPRSVEVILTERLVVDADIYIGVPVGLGTPVLGSLSFWTTSQSALTHPDGVAVAQVIATMLAGRLSYRMMSGQLAHQARHDALTELPNRLLLKERLELALSEARRAKASLAVVFIDLDRFKQVNDTLGHNPGDTLLQQVARRLRDCLHPRFTLARMGGDEFTAILTGITDDFHAIRVVQEMLESTRKPMRLFDFEMFVTASMGVSFFPKDGRDAMTLIQNADAAMYMAKSQGRDGFCLYSTNHSEEALEHFEMENYLRRAVENKQLELLYQPQVDRASRLTGFEVLTFWNHPKLGRISPAQFIPIAEVSGMITSIGAYILESAIRQTVAWNAAGYKPVRISVNVSSVQLEQDDFVPNIASLLSRYSFPPEQLDLEITEGTVIRDVEQAAGRLSELRGLGVRIMIDDFGTGYSSLSYLHQIPADGLKIDKAFFREERQGRVQMIQAMVTMAHGLGLTVTAEGIEDLEQMRLALDTGCDELQGHRFGVALRANAAGRLLKRASAGP